MKCIYVTYVEKTCTCLCKNEKKLSFGIHNCCAYLFVRVNKYCQYHACVIRILTKRNDELMIN